ncbi:hypothetical protein [Streptomyces prasinus]|uniref:hypothetical protein n=1 Tax=Streptomyces prasinus TaxID=67345 RepID=UPI002F409DB4
MADENAQFLGAGVQEEVAVGGVDAPVPAVDGAAGPGIVDLGAGSGGVRGGQASGRRGPGGADGVLGQDPAEGAAECAEAVAVPGVAESEGTVDVGTADFGDDGVGDAVEERAGGVSGSRAGVPGHEDLGVETGPDSPPPVDSGVPLAAERGPGQVAGTGGEEETRPRTAGQTGFVEGGLGDAEEPGGLFGRGLVPAAHDDHGGRLAGGSLFGECLHGVTRDAEFLGKAFLQGRGRRRGSRGDAGSGGPAGRDELVQETAVGIVGQVRVPLVVCICVPPVVRVRVPPVVRVRPGGVRLGGRCALCGQGRRAGAAVGEGGDPRDGEHRLETVGELAHEEVGAAGFHEGVGKVPDAAAAGPQVRLEYVEVPTRAGEPGEVLVHDLPAGSGSDRFRRGRLRY